VNEILPWDHLGAPVTRTFLTEEKDRSNVPLATLNCMDGKCHHCGVDPKECAPSRKAFRGSGEGSEDNTGE
jgi:hypothetical protein